MPTTPIAVPTAGTPAPTATSDDVPGLTPSERRATWSLSAIYVARMLGLFIVLPVFALAADGYAGATPLTVGLAIGIYGLLQAALQVPFGMLSDRIGRKPVIAAGLVLLAAGSVVAALADTITGVIVGRALQGAGALAAALMALASDLVREERRTRVMATLGASIGFAFVLALVLGPLLMAAASVDALFWLTAGCAAGALVLLYVAVPDPPVRRVRADVAASPRTMLALLRHPDLLRLDASIFALHLLMTAIFVVVPRALVEAGVGAEAQWPVWLGTLAVSIALMVPALVLAERRSMRAALLGAVIVLCAVQALLGMAGTDGRDVRLWPLLVAIALFFGALNTLEALLPSLVSRIAPAGARGSAMGLYSSAQFLGAFVGGAGAGAVLGAFGAGALYATLAGVCALWFALLAGLRVPARARTVRRALSPAERVRPDAVLAALAARPGVLEVEFVEAEGAAYVKVRRDVEARTIEAEVTGSEATGADAADGAGGAADRRFVTES